MAHDTPQSAFHWKTGQPSDFAKEEQLVPDPSPQLSYYHRKMAMGIHPRQLRKAGLPVIDQRFRANRGDA